MNKLLGPLGRTTHVFFKEVARIAHLVKESVYWAFFAPLGGKKGVRLSSFTKQLVFMGNQSLFITMLVATSVGAVLALQAAYQLKQFGAVMYTGSLVSVSMARELSPVIVSIVIAGRVGASIAAELGTMKVQEEIDALTTMGIPPVPFLVVPRTLAIMVALPCLTILGDALGIFGGFLIGVFGLDIAPELFLQESFNALVPKDILSGLLKSVVFAFIVGFIACVKGLGVTGGADGVGKATTQAVVLSIISIIIADCICTGLIFYVF